MEPKNFLDNTITHTINTRCSLIIPFLDVIVNASISVTGFQLGPGFILLISSLSFEIDVGITAGYLFSSIYIEFTKVYDHIAIDISYFEEDRSNRTSLHNNFIRLAPGLILRDETTSISLLLKGIPFLM